MKPPLQDNLLNQAQKCPSSYRLVAWITPNRWIHQVTEERKIPFLLSFVSNYQNFTSAQRWDDTGNVSCPLYADIDGNLTDSTDAAIAISREIRRMFGDYPRIFFSGSKGYHIVVPSTINHQRPEKVAQSFFDDICPSDYSTLIDPSVYRSQSLLRNVYSKASKEGFYKIPISFDELTKGHDFIRRLACSNSPRHIFPFYGDQKTISQVIAIHAENIVIYPETTAQHAQGPLPPCIVSLLNHCEKGARNATAYIIAKHLKSQNLTESQAIQTFLEHDFWRDCHETRSVRIPNIVHSVWKKPVFLGCRTGFDSKYLRNYCSSSCIHSEDFPEVVFRKDSNGKLDLRTRHACKGKTTLPSKS